MINTSFTATDAVKVIRIFLGSPSDLGPERRAAREAVTEINRTVGRPAGFQIDLIGWEDTLSSVGRPQAIINEELESCHVFIGMLWERWGTPPDLSGDFTSGFEEEYTRSYERFKRTGYPQMQLFFKDVDSSKVKDAGPELSKVLLFKNARIAEKEILFQHFANTQELGKSIRLGVADYINKLKQNAENEVRDSKAGNDPKASDNGPDLGQNIASSDSEVILLNELADKLSLESFGVEPVQVARLRNLSAALSEPSNDQVSLGPHDANLVYARRDHLVLSGREISALADAGLDAINNENAPIFSWLSNRIRALPLWLAYTTIVGPESRRVNAFQMMRLLRHDLSDKVGDYSRENLIKAWFSEGSDAIKNAALQYLGTMARIDEIEFAEAELKNANYGTRQSAAEAIINILLRVNGIDAAKRVIDLNVNELDQSVTDQALSFFTHLNDSYLIKAQNSSIVDVRLRALHILNDRKSPGVDYFTAALGDSSLIVRGAAVEMYLLAGHQLSDKEAEYVFVRIKPKGLLSIGRQDEKEGSEDFAKFKRRRSSQRAISDLIKDCESASFDCFESYFALCSRGEAEYQKMLRSDFDNRFVSYYENYTTKIANSYPDSNTSATIVKLLSDGEKWRRRQWMREVGDIFTRQRAKEDLSRIRLALDQDAMDPSALDIEFLSDLGTFEDIKRIDNAASDFRVGGVYQGLLGRKFPRRKAADAMLRLAGGKVDKLLSAGLSDDALPTIIRQSSKSAFSKVASTKIEALLYHSASNVRKAAALKILITSPITVARKTLSKYVNSDQHRYYNVILWLDLSISFPATIVRSIAEREMEKVV